MAETQLVTETQEPKLLCVVCKSELNPGALLCTECKSPQDWTRHILKWKDVIAALLTATPLLAAAWSLYQIAAQSEAPKAYAFAVECGTSEARLAIGNEGAAAAFLKNPELTVLRNDQEESTAIKLNIEKPENYPTILSAKQTATVTVRATAGQTSADFPRSSLTEQSCRLQFRIQTEDSSGRKVPLVAQCQCPPQK